MNHRKQKSFTPSFSAEPVIEPILSVIYPTYNEAQNITELLNRTVTALEEFPHEIIVVDDNSPDKTWELAEQVALAHSSPQSPLYSHSNSHSHIRVIRRLQGKKLVTAIRDGIHAARGKYVVWLDADLSMPPELIPTLLAMLQGKDIAVASRYASGGRDQRPLLRVASSRFINLLANVMLNFKVRDYDSGFVATRKEVLQQQPLAEDAGYGDYCIEFLYKAGKKGFTIGEVPFTFTDRRAGESKTADTLQGLFHFGLLYMKKIVMLRLGK